MKKIETLTSRERVIRQTNHQPVDRVPIDLGFHYSTGISAFAYWNLREYLGLSTDNIEVIDPGQFLARVDEDILKRFHCDCVLLKPKTADTMRWNPRGKYIFDIPASLDPQLQEDGSWRVKPQTGSFMPKDGFFFDSIRAPLVLEDTHMDDLAAEAERIFKETDYYTMYIGYGAYFPGGLIGQMKMTTDPDEIWAENEYYHKRQIRSVGKVIDAMGDYVQAIAINSDLGSQSGPMVRPSLHEKLCAPFIKDFCDFVHRNSDCKVFIHSCGSIRAFMPSLIDCGVDIFNPVQISAAGMDPAELKREYGDKCTFWGGGCNTQQVLNLGTPADVAQNVRELVNIFKPGGGFVFNQIHNVMGDIPPENIIAMLDTAYEESFY